MSSIWNKITNLATQVTDTLAVPHGGTGDTTLTSNGVLIGNGTGAVAITAAGSTSQVLIGGTPPSFGTVPAAALPTSSNTSKIRVYLGSDQTITTGVTARIAFDTATFDTNSEVDITVTKGKLTAKTAGYYYVYARVLLTTALTNRAADVFQLSKNGTRSAFSTGSDKVVTGNTWWHVCDFFNMNGSTDFIEAYFNNQESGSITISSNGGDQ